MLAEFKQAWDVLRGQGRWRALSTPQGLEPCMAIAWTGRAEQSCPVAPQLDCGQPPWQQQRGRFPDPLRRNGAASQHPPLHLRGFRGGHALLFEDSREQAGVEVVLLDGGEGGPLPGHAVAAAAEAVVAGEGFHQGGGAFISEFFGPELESIGKGMTEAEGFGSGGGHRIYSQRL